MNNSQLINQTSGNVEYYTPIPIIHAARRVMGTIDLDPASCAFANKNVQAKHFYNKEVDGLSQDWFGNVFMNHPFHRLEKACKSPATCKKKSCKKRGYHLDADIPGNAAWVNKFVGSYMTKQIQQGICITFASTSESWIRPLLDYPICLLNPRTHYYDADHNMVKGVTKGSMVTYLGHDTTHFILEFSRLGKVFLPA